MENIKLITQVRQLLIKSNQQVSELEMTSGNYDNYGNLISAEIPTVTTDLCEIGSYADVCYFVIILKSELFTRELFDLISAYPTAKIYGFKNFLENYYPKEDFSAEELMKKVKSEDLAQIQFDFSTVESTPESLLGVYLRIKLLFEKLNINVENQRIIDFTTNDKH